MWKLILNGFVLTFVEPQSIQHIEPVSSEGQKIRVAIHGFEDVLECDEIYYVSKKEAQEFLNSRPWDKENDD